MENNDTSPKPPENHQLLKVTIKDAHLRNHIFPSPNVHISVTVDNKVTYNTKKVFPTSHPEWNQQLTLIVTPLSSLLFRINQEDGFGNDFVRSEKDVNLLQLVRKFNGRCENVELTLQLMDNESNYCGSLTCLLDGLLIDMSKHNMISFCDLSRIGIHVRQLRKNSTLVWHSEKPGTSGLAALQSGDILSNSVPSNIHAINGFSDATPFNEMLKLLECSVCYEYLRAPIRQCINGHSLCGSCRCKLDKCPQCAHAFGKGRNFTLESMVTLFKYPCKNEKNGCSALLALKQIKGHEEFCRYGTFKCPLDDYIECEQRLVHKGLEDHCQNDHFNSVIASGSVTISFNDFHTNKEHGYFLKALDEYFLVRFKFDGIRLFWNVQFIGPKESASDFNYGIELNDNRNPHRFYCKTECSPFTDLERSFSFPNKCFKLDLELVQPLVSENKQLIFYVDVTKNELISTEC